MKNKVLLNKIFIFISIVVFIVLLTLIVLGNISRKGYLSEFQLNESLFSNGNYSYNFRIKYYSKIFRNSDIYGVYTDTNKITQDNNFIKEIKFNEKGSPFGVLTSTKALDDDTKIDSVNYKLRIKLSVVIILIVFLFVYILSINIVSIIINKDKIKLLIEYLNKTKSFAIKYNKYIFILYSIVVILFILFVIINSNIKRTAMFTNLELIAESKAGYVYKAKIDKSKLFSIDRNSIKIDDTNNIKYYGYSLEITNKPLFSWYSTNIYYTENNTFIISNESDEENGYGYDIEIPTYRGDKYKITILAKQFPDSGNAYWHLNTANDFKEITNKTISNDYIILTDTREVYSEAAGFLTFHLILPKGVSEIESILIESLNSNFNLNKNEIIFTSSNKTSNFNITADLVLQKIFYYIIPFAIILLIILYDTKKLFYKEITINDWILFGFISLFCLLSFQQWDMHHTIRSSYAYLTGHILDFYSYNASLPFIRENSYLPSTFILFAIWNIPLKLFFGVTAEATIENINLLIYVTWYNKMLTTIFYIASAFIIYKISRVLNFSNNKSKSTTYLWVTTPIAISSQFIFGQYDIFTLFFVLLGIYFYLKNDNFKFILFFAISLTFKYFSLFVFIILLLQREKNIYRIIKSCFMVFIPFVLEASIYIHDPAFINGVIGFRGTKYIFDLVVTTVPTAIFGIDIKMLTLFWIVLCSYVYLNDAKYSYEKNMLHYLALFSFMIFGMSFFHPQWVIFITPFLVLSTVVNKKYNFFIFIDVGLMFAFTWQIVKSARQYDSYLLENGIFSNIVDLDRTHILMHNIFSDRYNLAFTFFSGILLVNAIFKHPKFAMDDITDDISDSIPLMRMRFMIGTMLFIIPAFLVTLF